jgi:hypothetical protein
LQEIVIYEAPGRKIEVQVHTDSLWLSLTQMASLFGVNKPAISLSISRIFGPVWSSLSSRAGIDGCRSASCFCRPSRCRTSSGMGAAEAGNERP